MSNKQMQVSRRDFLRMSAAVAVAATLPRTPFFSGTVHAQSASQDLEILNYALTLEHLEAAAYAAVLGSNLLSGPALDYFRTFGEHEAEHVRGLTGTIQQLGGTPVQAQSRYNFPRFTSQGEVLTYFQGVEELGAAAYLGQAPRLQNPDLLTAAVSIHNVEAQHAAVLSHLIGVSPSPLFGMPKTMDEVLVVVGPILSMNLPGMPSTGRGGIRGGRTDHPMY